ncbi:succinylglutamate desuccinylase/aspartoacylase family protein [Myxosarcina sp. GI1]|uniref:M14 family zinc carboxypeptidase n=1 Tax=Myxosarcina sp. GI1 TaxID=1541065 RepID=UPI00055E6D4F|nr:succinylglutamate desuccinylase/aspartoacylase family protein [Myxosarcina sp. GI1]
MIPNISTIELCKLASGDNIALQVYKFIGRQPGKKTYIQANLHGAEIVGNAVIYQLIEFLSNLDESQINGEIWLVPVCNPLGVNQRSHFFSTGRFNSYDGKNWNRIFWDYEKECEDLEKFAKSQIDNKPEAIRQNYLDKILAAWQEEIFALQEPSSLEISKQYRIKLQSLCLDANYVIDIHSSSNQAIDYTFCFQDRENSAPYLLLEYAILFDEYDGDAFDEAFLKPWLALERELKKLGKDIRFDVESWTLELGSGMLMNPDSIDKGFKGIINYLTYKNILQLDEPAIAGKVNLVERDKIISYYAPTGGMIQARLPLGTKAIAGDRLYQLLSFNKQQQPPEVIDICAETSGIVFDISTNNCVNQGEYVLDILEL